MVLFKESSEKGLEKLIGIAKKTEERYPSMNFSNNDFLVSQEQMIKFSKTVDDDHPFKHTDFSKAPLWIIADKLYPVNSLADLKEKDPDDLGRIYKAELKETYGFNIDKYKTAEMTAKTEVSKHQDKIVEPERGKAEISQQKTRKERER